MRAYFLYLCNKQSILPMKILKLFFIALITAAPIFSNAQTGDEMKSVFVDAHTWTTSIKMGWNLGNALECQTGWNDKAFCWNPANNFNAETSWGNPKTTKEMLQAVREAGFDAVRIPVNWGAHISDESTCTIDAAWMNRVQEVVDWALQLGFKVLLNTHHEYWLEWHPTYDRQQANNNKLAKIWMQVANRFKDYGPDLAFAGINEVHLDGKWNVPTEENTAVTNSYNQTFVNTVRATGGNNLYRNLVVQCYSCNPDYGLTGFVVPVDKVENRLSIEYHYYRPWDYAGDAPKYYYWGEAYKQYGEVSTADNEAKVNADFARYKAAWYDKGLGVIMGEWGASQHYQVESKAKQLENLYYHFKTVREAAQKNNIATFVWDNNACGNGGDKFGIFDRNDNMSVAFPEALNAIQEASGQTVVDYSRQALQPSVVYQGDELMNWGEGKQLIIGGSKFAYFTAESKLMVTLDAEPGADYDMLQFAYGDWKSKPLMIISGKSYKGQVEPSKINGSRNTYTLFIGFKESSLNQLKDKGITLQGHGLRLRNVVVMPEGLVLGL